jgi:hypothetical protein
MIRGLGSHSLRIPEQAAHDSGMMPPTHSEIIPPTPFRDDVAHHSGMISPGVPGASAGRLRSSPLAVPKERPDASRENNHAPSARSSYTLSAIRRVTATRASASLARRSKGEASTEIGRSYNVLHSTISRLPSQDLPQRSKLALPLTPAWCQLAKGSRVSASALVPMPQPTLPFIA